MILFLTEAIFFILILYVNGSIIDEGTNPNNLNFTDDFLINLTQLIPMIASIANINVIENVISHIIDLHVIK
jgi:hypothetical protein